VCRHLISELGQTVGGHSYLYTVNLPQLYAVNLPFVKAAFFRYIYRIMADPIRDFAQLVTKTLRERGLSVRAAEISSGLRPDAIRNVLRRAEEGGDGPTLSRVAEICKALGLEMSFGAPQGRGILEVIDQEAEYAQIPLHDACLSAGNGVLNSGEEIVGALAFRREWLSRMRIDPSRAALARAHGDSMEPSFSDGDMLLLDLSITTAPLLAQRGSSAKRSPIFALVDDGEAKVKRVNLADPKIAVLTSDNPDYPPTFARTSTLQIIGKVVWWGHANTEV
jgi:SOS-response transcriptional repressor LexA